VRKAALALLALGAFAALMAMSTGAGAASTKSYLVLAKGNPESAAFKQQITAAGGTITNTIPEAGIAVVSTTNANFKANAASLGTIAPNLRVQWVDPARQVEAPVVSAANPPNSGDDDFFFDLQWGHDAIDAPEAWEAGERGDGARVAVLDTGFDLDHPDLAPNIDFAASKDFTGEGLQYTLPDPFSHGTHTAGTVAAADNAFGTIGVAPEATLVLVKVLSDDGFGTFEDVIEGIVYASTTGNADIISMSLGARLPKNGDPSDPEADTPEEVRAIKHAIDRASQVGYHNGVTMIASAGNDAENYDNLVDVWHLPSDGLNVLAISATAPIGWAVDPTTFLDHQASYTNFGRSVIDYGAPGGDFVYPGNENCTVAGLLRPCWVFDLVFSTGSTPTAATATWYWSAGTSMAAPHVSGVAALIVGKHDGNITAAQVQKAILAGADDLGPRGRDATYGRGRVNAANSVAFNP
jgi:subtilisin family serine protease